MDLRLDLLRDELDLSGALGLDFVNTVVPLRGGPVDLLHHPETFQWWLKEAGSEALWSLFPPDPAGRRRLTAEAARLREALVSVFRAVAEGSGPVPHSAATTVDRALGASPAVQRVSGLGLSTRYRPTSPLALLTPLASSALEVAFGAKPERLRPCAADGCRRWFEDTSKGGRRRWCSMERCGNRAKAERYRARQTE